jgi:hypothetical protein
MTDIKFTPGPWEYDKDNNAIYNKYCNYICDAPLNNPKDKHLIAAAPELYDSLDKIVKMSILSGFKPMKDSLNPVHAWLYDAQELLAKARGEI